MPYKHLLLAASFLLSLTTLDAQATLTAYTAAGNQSVVYDNVTDISWTGNANLLGALESTLGYSNAVNAMIAASPEIREKPNNLGFYSEIYTLSAADFSSTDLGKTSWFGAIAFTIYLNSINYAGSNQWGLPTLGTNSPIGTYQPGDQMGQLYYDELNALAFPGTNGNNWGIFRNGYDGNGTSGNVGPFNDVQADNYWLATEVGFGPSNFWDLSSGYGWEGGYHHGVNFFYYAWAVSPGQVAAVPVHNTALLFGTGLAGLLGLIRRRQAR